MFLGTGMPQLNVFALERECDYHNQSPNDYTDGRGFCSDGRVKSYASNLSNETSNTTLEDGGNKAEKFHGSYYVDSTKQNGREKEDGKMLCARTIDALLLRTIHEMFFFFYFFVIN